MLAAERAVSLDMSNQLFLLMIGIRGAHTIQLTLPYPKAAVPWETAAGL